jgi:transcriptional regulator with XRE-family HTH domain
MAERLETFSDQIRATVNAAEMSRYRICVKIGISQATMSRFMSRKGGLSMEVLDKLARLLGLSVTVKPKRQKEEG